MLAILRRVVLVAGLLSAAWLALHIETPLVRLSIEDPSLAYERAYGQRSTGQGTPYEPLAAFVGDRLKGRAFQTTGPEWRQLFADVAAAAPEPSPLAARRGLGQADRAVFFRLDEPPLGGIASQIMADERSFAYLRLLTPQGLRLARVSIVQADEVAKTAPGWLAYPHRRWAAWPLAIGLACYVLLPWRRRPAANALRYDRTRTVVVPDALAALFCTLFFALPLVMIGTSSGPGELLSLGSGGRAFITVPSWFLAAAAASVFAFSAWHEAFRLELEPLTLHRVALVSDRRIPFAALRRAEYAETRPSPWLRTVAGIADLFGGRAVGQALLGGRTAWGIALTENDGRRTLIRAGGLSGFARFADALEKAGVPIEGLDEIRHRLARRGR